MKIYLTLVIVIFSQQSSYSSNFSISKSEGEVTCTYININSQTLFFSFAEHINGSILSKIYKIQDHQMDIVLDSVFGLITSMIIYDSNLVVAGKFNTIKNFQVINIAQIASGNIVPISTDMNSDFVVRNMCIYGNNLLLSIGENNPRVDFLISFNGTELNVFNTTCFGVINKIIYCNSKLILNGEFWDDSLNIHSLAELSNGNWTEIGLNFSGTINSHIEYNNQLYLCGNFVDSVPDSLLFYCAKFDGNILTSLGNSDSNFVLYQGLADNRIYSIGIKNISSGNYFYINYYDTLGWHETELLDSYEIRNVTSFDIFEGHIYLAGEILDPNSNLLSFIELNIED